MPVFCTSTSKIKMVFGLKNGNNHLKLKKGNKLNLPCYYSPIKHNGKTENEIIKRMLSNQGIKDTEKYQNSQQLMFYNNHTGNYIKTVKL